MPEDAYWEHIERYFVKKRGSALILSPKDWPLIRSWQERKIPLDVIYEGNDRAFEQLETKQPLHQRWAIRSLKFCQHEVETAWSDWQQEYSPVSESPAEAPVVAERRKLSVKLHNTIKQLQRYAGQKHYQFLQADLLTVIHALEPLLETLQETEEAAGLAAIKEDIGKLEKQLLSCLEKALPADIHQSLYAKAETRVASHKRKMKPSVYQETLYLAFLQELRHLYPLPSFL